MTKEKLLKKWKKKLSELEAMQNCLNNLNSKATINFANEIVKVSEFIKDLEKLK